MIAKTAPFCVIDTETTGLRRDSAIWEIGLIDADGAEHQWYLPVTNEAIRLADPIALSIGRFHERHPQGNVYNGDYGYGALGGHAYIDEEADEVYTADVIAEVLRLTHGKHLVGAVPSFDEKRLELLAESFGLKPSYHYHLVDVEALAVGYLRGLATAAEEMGTDPLDGWGKQVFDDAKLAALPWQSGTLSRAVGVNPDEVTKHRSTPWRRARPVVSAAGGSYLSTAPGKLWRDWIEARPVGMTAKGGQHGS